MLSPSKNKQKQRETLRSRRNNHARMTKLCNLHFPKIHLLGCFYLKQKVRTRVRAVHTNIGASRGVCISQIFTNFQFNSQLFTTLFSSLVKLLNAGICISGIRPASGGVNLPKWTSSRHFRTVHNTQVHHITFYVVNPSIPLNGWVTTQPKKKPPKKKINSQLFTTFHQPSQFYSGFRVVKTCHIL